MKDALTSFGFGGVIGLIYLACYGLRALFGFRREADFILDLLFCACAAVLIALFLEVFMGGRLRFYIFANLTVGFLVFNIMFSKPLAKCAQNIYNRVIEKKKLAKELEAKNGGA